MHSVDGFRGIAENKLKMARGPLVFCCLAVRQETVTV